MATIRDIAQKAGVSVASVSMALNNRDGVSEETRRRIFEIAKEMNYSLPAPNRTIDKQHGTVRFVRIAQHGHTVNRDHNVFISDYIDGLSSVAIEKRYNLEIVPYEQQEIDTVIGDLEQSHPAGAIILGTELQKNQIGAFKRIPFPVVFIDTFYPYTSFDFVDMDNHDAVYLVLREFVEQGHTDIGMITTQVEVENFRQRVRGFHKAREALNMPPDCTKIDVDSTFDGAYADFGCYLDNGGRLPGALFCSNDIIAFGCMRALTERNIRIPEDVSLIGFDNLPQAEMSTPPLTTIDVKKHRIGSTAMSILIERIEAEEPFPPMKVSIGASLVRRKSVLNIV